MTAETAAARPWPDQGFHGVRRPVRPVVGVLADGTPYYAPMGEIVSDGTASPAAISREAGLNKDWLHRHLAEVDPAVAAAIRPAPAGRDGPRWVQAVTALGFADVPSYLRERHLARYQSVSAIGAELGMSNHAVTAALARHGLAPPPVRLFPAPDVATGRAG